MSFDAPTLIFDGDCGFCTSVARHFEKRSRTPLKTTPWQRTNLTDFGLTKGQASEQVFLYRDGQLFGGHECFAELMRIQGDPFHRLVAATMRAPGMRTLSAAGYRFVARNRHRFPGGTPACEIPSE